MGQAVGTSSGLFGSRSLSQMACSCRGPKDLQPTRGPPQVLIEQERGLGFRARAEILHGSEGPSQPNQLQGFNLRAV